MTSVWNSVRGYVKIKIKGMMLEKVINECLLSGITLWDIERPAHNTLLANTKSKDFFKLRNIVRKLKCRLYLLEKKGTPFAFAILRVRKFIVIGATLFIAGLFVSSLFVWDIRIEGNAKASNEQIMRILEANGAKVGSFWPALDFSKIENQTVIICKDVVWAGIRLNGSRLVIEVVEQPNFEKPLDDGSPADIIASKNAIVSSIVAYAGKAVASENKPVKKGDMLITGVIGAEDAPSIVHARGEVFGRVWYSAEADALSVEEKVIRTGQYDFGVIVDLGWFITAPNSQFETFESETLESSSFHNFLPLTVTKQKYYQTKKVKAPIDEQKLMTIVSEMAWKKAIEKIPNDARIVDMKYNYFKAKDKLICSVSIEALENIGEQVQLKYPMDITTEITQ